MDTDLRCGHDGCAVLVHCLRGFVLWGVGLSRVSPLLHLGYFVSHWLLSDLFPCYRSVLCPCYASYGLGLRLCSSEAAFHHWHPGRGSIPLFGSLSFLCCCRFVWALSLQACSPPPAVPVVLKN
jgi:hypothetical protein